MSNLNPQGKLRAFLIYVYHRFLHPYECSSSTVIQHVFVQGTLSCYPLTYIQVPAADVIAVVKNIIDLVPRAQVYFYHGSVYGNTLVILNKGVMFARQTLTVCNKVKLALKMLKVSQQICGKAAYFRYIDFS